MSTSTCLARERRGAGGANLSHVAAVPRKGAMRRGAIDHAEMVYVPAGAFLMGDNDIDDIKADNPRHVVRLSAYWIYKNLVTVRQYKVFCAATNRSMPQEPECPAGSQFNPDWSREDHPIVNVTWDDALAYAHWAHADLPTEAQWEKAARGTQGRKYPWGNDFDPAKLWCSRRALGLSGGTHRVGDLGVSLYGCTDMAGNVWEWCKDWYDKDYWKGRTSFGVDPANRSVGKRKYHVLRGGSWHDHYREYFRSAFRLNIPSFWYSCLGFRCVVRADAR